MRTLILPPKHGPEHGDDGQILWDAALAEGWRTVRFPGWKPPKGFVARGGPFAVYGEPLFVAAVAERLGLAVLEPPLDWLAHVPRPLLARRVIATQLGDARQFAGPAFIEPADDKCFPARVYASGAELPDAEALPDDTPVYVSDPAAFTIEVRAFLCDGEPVAMSSYARHGQPDTEAAATELEAARGFVRQVVRSHATPPAMALDVGMLEGGASWAVIRGHAACSAAIYACDPVRVLDVLLRACVKRAALSDKDGAWVVAR